MQTGELELDKSGGALSTAVNFDGQYRLDDASKCAFERESFINLGQLFSANEMAVVRSAFERVQSSPGGVDIIGEGSSNMVRSIMGWENADAVLAHFARDARVLGAVQSILGNDVVFHQTKYNPKAPNGIGEKWDPHRGITFWHYLDGVPDPKGMVSIFVAVTEQTKENGATYTWKRAHNMSLDDLRDETDFGQRKDGELGGDTAAYLSLQIKPEKLVEYDQQFEKEYFEGPAGTVWLLDSRNLHASQPNLSEKVRILVADVYRSVANHPLHPRENLRLCNTSQVPIKPHFGSLD